MELFKHIKYICRQLGKGVKCATKACEGRFLVTTAKQSRQLTSNRTAREITEVTELDYPDNEGYTQGNP